VADIVAARSVVLSRAIKRCLL